MSPKRKNILVNDRIYHVFSRSIAKFIVLNDSVEFDRMYQLCNLCRYVNFEYKYSQFLDLSLQTQKSIIDDLRKDNELLVEIVAYCLMPTHIHFTLKQISNDGIAKYVARVLNGYTKYFNIKHQRNGPLWASRFKNVLVSTDEQLLHLTRYIHLNPTSANLVRNPEDWAYSSYKEYIQSDGVTSPICNFHDLVSMDPKQYKKFVADQKDYQRQLSIIKEVTIDDYTG